jgi:hypothetical protein
VEEGVSLMQGNPLQNVIPHLINRPLPLIVVWLLVVFGLTVFGAPWWSYVLVTVGLVVGLTISIRFPHFGMQDEYMDKHLRGAEPEAAQARVEDSRGKQKPSDELGAIRRDEYARNRGLFLVHSWQPSKKPGEVADIVIRLREHLDTSDRLSVLREGKVDSVRYQLGPMFSEEPFVKRDPDGGFLLSVSAYKPMLCVAEVVFNDGHEPVRLSRYLDFPVGSEP